MPVLPGGSRLCRGGVTTCAARRSAYYRFRWVPHGASTFLFRYGLSWTYGAIPFPLRTPQTPSFPAKMCPPNGPRNRSERSTQRPSTRPAPCRDHTGTRRRREHRIAPSTATLALLREPRELATGSETVIPSTRSDTLSEVAVPQPVRQPRIGALPRRASGLPDRPSGLRGEEPRRPSRPRNGPHSRRLAHVLRHEGQPTLCVHKGTGEGMLRSPSNPWPLAPLPEHRTDGAQPPNPRAVPARSSGAWLWSPPTSPRRSRSPSTRRRRLSGSKTPRSGLARP